MNSPKKYLVSVFVLFTHLNFTENLKYPLNSDTQQELYEKSYNCLVSMLKGDTAINFKNAVFTVENTFLEGQLNYDTFNIAIEYYTDLARRFAEKSTLLYEGDDKKSIQILGAIFMIMTAEKPFFLDSGYYFIPDPFTYDFEDFWGEKDWTKMFVSKLLFTHSGNCHSLPYLYKIIGDELNVKAYLSLAPNHVYIKIHSRNPKIGWYNTELTNSTFPIDAWIKSSGYVHLDAIRNGLYMDTLSAKKNIALCLVDLAKGYERLFDDTEFPMKCAVKAIEYYPNCINAMLLKAETMKKQYENIVSGKQRNDDNRTESETLAQLLFDNMEKLYFDIFKLGYRTMPREMYMDWLIDLKEHKDKYINNDLISNLQQNNQ